MILKNLTDTDKFTWKQCLQFNYDYDGNDRLSIQFISKFYQLFGADNIQTEQITNVGSSEIIFEFFCTSKEKYLWLVFKNQNAVAQHLQGVANLNRKNKIANVLS